MNNKQFQSSAGVGVLGVLQIIFVVLKLLNLISWNWGVVLIPLWIQLCLIMIIVIVLIGVYSK